MTFGKPKKNGVVIEAHKALNAEIEIGLMLPCNVIVYDLGARLSSLPSGLP